MTLWTKIPIDTTASPESVHIFFTLTKLLGFIVRIARVSQFLLISSSVLTFLHYPVLPSRPSAFPVPAAMSASNMLKKTFPQVDAEGHNLPPSPAPSSPHGTRRYNIATELVYTESNDQYNASSVPIYQVRPYPLPYK